MYMRRKEWKVLIFLSDSNQNLNVSKMALSDIVFNENYFRRSPVATYEEISLQIDGEN
jgi:hypothetical protein